MWKWNIHSKNSANIKFYWYTTFKFYQTPRKFEGELPESLVFDFLVQYLMLNYSILWILWDNREKVGEWKILVSET